jgi:hypothetical protein
MLTTTIEKVRVHPASPTYRGRFDDGAMSRLDITVAYHMGLPRFRRKWLVKALFLSA